jgi:DHA3 family tetracycline resistance protein-like MFS transporter
VLDRSAYRYLRTNRVFARLWAGQAISGLGDTLYDVAIVWYLLDATGSALLAGAVAVSTIVGRALGSLAAGALIGRVGARRLMLVSDVWRLALTLGIAVPWLLGRLPSPPELYALALTVAIGSGWFNPARAAALPDVVPRDHLVHANALDGVSGGVVSGLSWALGGIVVAAIGPGPALLMDGVTFLTSYLLVRSARWQGPPVPTGRADDLLGQTVAAVRATSADPLTRTVLVVETVHVLAMGLFLAALPAFIRDLGNGAALYGLQGGVFWVGVVVGSVALGLRPWGRVGYLYPAGVTLNAIGNLLVGLAHGAGGVLGAVFVAGLGWPAWQTGFRSLLQAHAPPRVRGTTFAALEAVTSVALVPAWLIGGWAADHLSARTIMSAAPLVHFMLGICLWLAPGVRRFALASRH